MHPRDEPDAAVVRRGVRADPPDRIGRGDDRLPDQLPRQVGRGRKRVGDVPRLLGDLPQRLFAVQRLAARDEPDLGLMTSRSEPGTGLRPRAAAGRRGRRGPGAAGVGPVPAGAGGHRVPGGRRPYRPEGRRRRVRLTRRAVTAVTWAGCSGLVYGIGKVDVRGDAVPATPRGTARRPCSGPSRWCWQSGCTCRSCETCRSRNRHPSGTDQTRSRPVSERIQDSSGGAPTGEARTLSTTRSGWCSSRVGSTCAASSAWCCSSTASSAWSSGSPGDRMAPVTTPDRSAATAGQCSGGRPAAGVVRSPG